MANLNIISIKDPFNYVNVSLISGNFQEKYQQVYERIIQVQDRCLYVNTFPPDIKLMPLYFNYFDVLSVDTARTLHVRDGIWFFNVFVALSLTWQQGRTLEQLHSDSFLDKIKTGGLELPTGIFDIRDATDARILDHRFHPDLNIDEQISGDTPL